MTAGVGLPDAPRRPARFITLEGGEGAGKSTQARRLAERLHGLGIGTVSTREPGGSPGAEAVRHVLLSGAAERFGPDVEAILFAAARADHVDETIRPALERGDWVICDRFADSTRVYQAEIGTALIDALEAVALDGLVPDLTLLLDLPAETGLERARARRGDDAVDRFEKDALALHVARREAFLALARRHPERIAVIDAGAEADAVAEAIWATVAARFGLASDGPAG